MAEHPHGLDTDIVIALAGALRPTTPDPARAQRMRSRVLAAAAGTRAAGSVVRAQDGEWHTLLPGLQVKRLHRDRNAGSFTGLWRLAPGASIPPHPHRLDEECLVLEGEVLIDGQEYRAGDYMLAATGSLHSEVSSRVGALMLIRGEDPFAMPARSA